MKDKNCQKNLLLISYFYPPLSGPGIQRPCKIVHYLRKHNWYVDVITVQNIIFHSIDLKFSEECNENNLYKINSLDPMAVLSKFKGKNNQGKNRVENKIYFKTPEMIKKIIRSIFPIDDKIGWLPFAVRKGKFLCKENEYSAVMATIGPYTSALIAYLISKKCNLPLIIDYRDSWSSHPYLDFLSFFHRKYSEHWEKKILNSAEVISTHTKWLKESLIFKYGKHLKGKIHIMYNAWDERDFKNVKRKKNNNKVLFYYIGGFYGYQTPKYFIESLEELYSNNKLPEDIEIIFVGNFFVKIKKIIKNSIINKFIKVLSQVPHRKAIEYMLSADVLLLFIASYKSTGVVTGKVFEYIRSKNEIFAMIPPGGECAEILRSYNHNYICAMEDNEKIKENFIGIYKFVKIKKYNNRKIDNQYSRENQVNQFEKFLLKRVFRDEI